MIIHGNKQISEIVYARKASEGGGTVRLTNIIRGAQVVFGGLKPDVKNWLEKATKAAILAAFGQTDGKAVINATNAYLNGIAYTDPTKATDLAKQLNIYAIEDAYIVYSLVPTLGVTRWIKNSVEGAYFDVGVPITAKSEIEVSFVRTETANGIQIMGTQTTNMTGLDIFIFEGDNLRFYTGGSSLSSYTLGVIQRNEIADLIIRNGYAKCNNTESAPEIKYENGYRNFIFVISDKNTPRSTSNKFVGKWGKYIHKEDGVPVREMYPFIRNNVCGMIDVISGIFYQNANTSGSFTIEYTLQDGTPWIPLNQTP